MSYLVLSRKWRPNNFEDIIGQNHITKALTNAINIDKISMIEINITYDYS